jgi:hypothetical protein
MTRVKKQTISMLILGFTALGMQSFATARMLSCSPTVLKSYSTLMLRFEQPHPAELAIRTPGGTDYFLAYDHHPAMPPGQTPIADKESFRKMSELVLPVGSAMGSPLVYGREFNELIFREPGVYTVTLAEVIQTDAKQPEYYCKVTLKPALPKKPR